MKSLQILAVQNLQGRVIIVIVFTRAVAVGMSVVRAAAGAVAAGTEITANANKAAGK